LSNTGATRRDLVLGGAQFGAGYGKFVRTPKLTLQTVEEVLQLARMNEIDEIDLAQSYLNAVANLARSSLSSMFSYSTKINYAFESQNGIVSTLYSELQSLKVPHFRTILIHNWASLNQTTRLEAIDFLNTLLSDGICEQIGVSLYSVDEMDFGGWVPNCIQAPLNFYNRDFLSDKVALKLASQGTKFMARSIFHQGVLLNPHLFEELPDLAIFKKFCKENNFSNLQGAISIYDSQSLFTSLTVGITNANELDEILCEPINACDLESFPTISAVNPDFKDPRRW
jgi:aryl-alcohol dehydrogenase-like predicted oxidoreductase